MDGWIKIHRKFEKWEWRSKPEMVSLFLHMLTQANFESAKWRGIVIERGQCIFGRATWSEKLGISEQSMRTCIERLKSTNEITIKSTNQFSIITVVNYEEYQSIDNVLTEKSTSDSENEQQTTNKRSTTPKEVKKERNKEKEEEGFALTGSPPPKDENKLKKRTRLPVDWELSQEEGDWADLQGMTYNEIKHEEGKFKDHWIGTGEAKADWPATWRNWVRRFIERKQNHGLQKAR